MINLDFITIFVPEQKSFIGTTYNHIFIARKPATSVIIKVFICMHVWHLIFLCKIHFRWEVLLYDNIIYKYNPNISVDYQILVATIILNFKHVTKRCLQNEYFKFTIVLEITFFYKHLVWTRSVVTDEDKIEQ